MTQRGALVVGSGLAALCIAAAASGLLWLFKPGRIEQIDPWSVAQIILLPALLSAMFSAAWWTRNSGWARRDTVESACLIVFGAYAALACIVALTSVVKGAISGANAHLGLLELAGSAALLGGGVALIGVALTGFPAFLCVWLILRFMRRRWSSAISPEVVP